MKRKPKVILTPREKEVVHWLTQGFSSRKIAEQLGISFHTVQDHRKSILQKFNTHTTIGMIMKASKMRL